MNNSVTVLFGRRILHSSIMMKIYCTTEEGGVRPKLIDLEEGEGSEFSIMDVVNERPLLLLVSSISLLIFF